jgi:hypothetical protein
MSGGVNRTDCSGDLVMSRLLADLPIRMLLRAMIAPWRFRRGRLGTAAKPDVVPAGR